MMIQEPHGRYLGYIRQLKPRLRAEVKAVREKKGVEAAIRTARKLASKLALVKNGQRK